MKTKLLPIISLFGNVILVGVIVHMARDSARNLNPPRVPDAGIRPDAEAPQMAALTVADTSVVEVVSFDWQRVESEDYSQYIANLRAIGCPAETIRDIIVADVNKLFSARARTELGVSNRFEYWKGGNPFGNLFSEKTIASQQALDREKQQLLKTLLGNDAPAEVERSSASVLVFGSLLDFLSPEKQSQIKAIEEKAAGKLMSSMNKAAKGDPNAMRTAQAEKDAELLQVLTPDEKFQYDLRMSQTAVLMRMQMGGLELSEQEFQEIFKVRKQFDDQFGIMGIAASTTEEQQRRDEAKRAGDERIASLLGNRYSEYKYEMGGEWAAQMLHRIANEKEIPRDSAVKAYAMTDAARGEAAKVKADPLRSVESKQAALQLIYDETTKSVTQVLGMEGTQAYLKKTALIPGFKPSGESK